MILRGGFSLFPRDQQPRQDQGPIAETFRRGRCHGFTSMPVDGRAAKRDRRQDRLHHIFETLDDVVGQHSHHQVAVLLKLQVLAAVAAIRLRILEMVVTVDLDDQLQGAGERDRPRSIDRARSGSRACALSSNNPAVSGTDSSRSNKNRSAALRAGSLSDSTSRGTTSGGFTAATRDPKPPDRESQIPAPCSSDRGLSLAGTGDPQDGNSRESEGIAMGPAVNDGSGQARATTDSRSRALARDRWLHKVRVEQPGLDKQDQRRARLGGRQIGQQPCDPL